MNVVIADEALPQESGAMTIPRRILVSAGIDAAGSVCRRRIWAYGIPCRDGKARAGHDGH